jgi:hypothetical protein
MNCRQRLNNEMRKMKGDDNKKMEIEEMSKHYNEISIGLKNAKDKLNRLEINIPNE